MEVLRQYAFRDVKAAHAGELFERLLAAVGRDAAGRARFVLKDRTGGPSAIARAIKKYPELERDKLPDIANPGGWVDRLLSNIDGHHQREVPCDFIAPEKLLTLVRGVPRSYPFWDFEVIFLAALPWQTRDDVEPLLPAAENWSLFGRPIPCMRFSVRWTPSGYRAGVYATVPLGDA